MRIPDDIAELLRVITAELPLILAGNLVGVYIWGSLTYDAFDESCSDVDLVAVTQWDIDEREFVALDNWFANLRERNRWARRIDMRFVIDGEFLDKTSSCCGLYHYQGKLTRHGSDGNPFIWLNVAKSGITLWGQDAAKVVPPMSDDQIQPLIRNAYAILTAYLICFTTRRRNRCRKQEAMRWATANVTKEWRPLIQTAEENRLKNGRSSNYLCS